MKTMTTRPVPSTGEALPVVGCGTYVGFDVEDELPPLAAERGIAVLVQPP